MSETFDKEFVYKQIAAASRYGFQEGLKQASFLIAQQIRTHGESHPPISPESVLKALRDFRTGVELHGCEIQQWEGWLRVCDALDKLDRKSEEEAETP